MLYLLRDFSAIAILWYRVPHMNGVDLNLPGKPRVIKIDRTSILNNDGMVACGFLGIKCERFTHRSSSDSVKPTKRIAVRENKFWKDCEKRYFSTKLLRNTFDWMNLNEIEHSKRYKTLNTKVLLRAHSRLKYDQLARFAHCAFGAPCTMNKNALSWLAQVF